MTRNRRRLGLVFAFGVVGIGLLLSRGASDASRNLRNVAQTATTAQPLGVASAAADPRDFSALYAGKLNVWFTVSPYNSYRIQSVLDAFHQDFPQFQLNYRIVLQSSFVAEWNAESGDAMPDVAFIESNVQLRPLWDENAIWQDWGHDRFRMNGWWVISKHSTHTEAGQAFLRWLATSPRWQPTQFRNSSLPIAEIKAIETKALAGAVSLQSGDHDALSALLDPDAARAFDDPMN